VHLKWKTEFNEHSHEAVVSLGGEVVSDFDKDHFLGFKKMLERVTSKEKVVFDFAELSRMNSIGVRATLLLIALIPKEIPVVYRNCVSEFVEHLNILPDFLKRGSVESVLLTEYCSNGHSPQKRVLTIGKEILPGMAASEVMKKLPKVFCSQCGSDLEFHEVASIFFSFNERSKEP
jgi:hypothetical protein